MSEKRNVPKLRFQEYDQPWIDGPLGKFTSWKSGGTPSKDVKEFWNGDIPWISASSMVGTKYSDSNNKVTELGSRNGTRSTPKGSLLLLVRGSMLFNKIPVGIATRDVTFNQDVKAILPTELITSEFLLQWFLKSETNIRGIVGGTGIGAGKLDTKELQSIPFYHPALPEQQKIAEFLTAVDRRIELLQVKKEKLEAYKKGVMQQIFTRKIRFKAYDGSEFPDWEEKKLGEVLTIGSGRDYKHLNEGNIPVYGTGGIMGFVDGFLFDGESVGIGRKGTIDKPVFLSGKFWTVDTLFYTHSFKSATPRFVYRLFLTINWKKHNEASGVPSLSKAIIEKLVVKIPTVREQERISLFLDSVDLIISSLDTQINTTQTWKKGLLQQMFL